MANTAFVSFPPFSPLSLINSSAQWLRNACNPSWKGFFLILCDRTHSMLIWTPKTHDSVQLERYIAVLLPKTHNPSTLCSVLSLVPSYSFVMWIDFVTLASNWLQNSLKKKKWPATSQLCKINRRQRILKALTRGRHLNCHPLYPECLSPGGNPTESKPQQ